MECSAWSLQDTLLAQPLNRGSAQPARRRKLVTGPAIGSVEQGVGVDAAAHRGLS